MLDHGCDIKRGLVKKYLTFEDPGHLQGTMISCCGAVG
jgi:hypothetical protein